MISLASSDALALPIRGHHVYEMPAMRPLSAAKTYSTIGVETGVAAASPHSLILMLYDGALQAIGDARRHLEARAPADKGRAVSRAISIIDEGLKGCLDRSTGGEIASHLAELYDYMCRRLLLASLKDDRAGFDEVARLLNELRGAWATIAATPRDNPTLAPV